MSSCRSTWSPDCRSRSSHLSACDPYWTCSWPCYPGRVHTHYWPQHFQITGAQQDWQQTKEKEVSTGSVFNVLSWDGWNLTGLLARSHRYRVDTHWCVKDLIVANRGAQIPADVEGQVSVTWPFVSLNCRATRQALTERHKYKTASGGAACTVTFLNLFAGSVIEMTLHT